MATARGNRVFGSPGIQRLRRCALRAHRLLATALFALPAFIGTAHAADRWESWPEISAFVNLHPQARLYLDAAYAQDVGANSQTLDAAAYVDISLMPILRPHLLQEDWARSRYLWARIGYDHVFQGERWVPTPAEDRCILSLYGKGPLPAAVWFELRSRADLRWIEGDYSTRYRLRGEFTREFAPFGRPLMPYLNVEWFWDTRYSGVSRLLFMGGTEVTVSRNFRFELYLARQEDRLPSEVSVNALGLVAKWYF
jgi:hypothetical protein